MEDRKSSPISIQEEKIISQEEGDSNPETATGSSKKLVIDLQILLKKFNDQKPSQRVHVTVRPRTPVIKTIFLAERRRFYSSKGSDKSRSILAFGDHPSFSSHLAEARWSSTSPSPDDSGKEHSADQGDTHIDQQPRIHHALKTKHAPTEKCYAQAQPGKALKHHKPCQNLKKSSNFPHHLSNFIVAHSSNNKKLPTSISKENKRIHLLERKVRRQEMVLGAMDPYHSQSSSDEGSRENIMRNRSRPARPGCSYIDHYSHIPETSAFQKYAQQSASLSLNNGAIQKEHNSEQYGRDFTAYDGITARGRRQCTSANYKRDDQPRQAAERVTKIRHKLNPVRDYRLMDTVHYLAQGEFAPRNDGIKLTPSREAVLSDIIWEDVCRTHWPSTRLGRRHQERSSTRCELQRLIDNLLRERVAHVERRRRRHYRIVKLTQRHESSAIGKTGDIIVASHKHKPEDDGVLPGHNASGAMVSSRRCTEHSHRGHRSHDRLMSPEASQRRRAEHEDCTPGPSYAVHRSSRRREPTYCYHAAGPSTQLENSYKPTPENFKEKVSISSTSSSERQRTRNPRLVVKKDSHRKQYQKEEVNLEHFILLPTLVVRTPSNVKRQKKFNELYHRILNQLRPDQNTATRNEQTDPRSHSDPEDGVTSTNHMKNK